MITSTFTLAELDLKRVPGAEAGSFTMYYWQRLLNSVISNKMLYEPIVHSLTIAACVSAVSITFGAIIAWLMVRTDSEKLL